MLSIDNVLTNINNSHFRVPFGAPEKRRTVGSEMGERDALFLEAELQREVKGDAS